MTNDPRYPIGKYEPQPFSEELKQKFILDIQFLPEELERALLNLDQAQLATPYREGGWSVIQLVHHVADSHMNAYIRLKLAITENNPTIKPYDEKAWAELPDNNQVPVNVSITLLHALHQRWTATLKNLSENDWNPASCIEMSVWFLLGLYAWHGKHHTKHITALKKSKGW